MRKLYLFGLLFYLLSPVISGQNNFMGNRAEKNKSPYQATLRPKTTPIHKATKKKLTSTPIYGNEWINYNLKYYKIKVAHDGIYRIDSSTMANAGFNLAANNPKYYKLFYRGQQQYIYVSAQTNPHFQYIEFYGLHNDGTIDSLVYDSSTAMGPLKFQPNPYYSMFNDTSTYYLTYDSTSPGFRMNELNNTNFTSYTPNPYFMVSVVNQTNAQYDEGFRIPDGSFTTTDPRFTQSECWTDAYIAYGNSATYYPAVANVYSATGAPNAFIRTVYMGADTGAVKQVVVTSNVGSLWKPDTLSKFEAHNKDTSFAASNVYTAANNFSMTFSVTTAYTYTATEIGVSYIYVNYPHTMNLLDSVSFTMDVPDGANGLGGYAYLDMTNFVDNTPKDTIRFYDLTNHHRFVVTQNAGNYQVLIPNTLALKHCFMTSDSVIKHNSYFNVQKLVPVGPPGGNGTFTNFKAISGNYLIVSHPKLWTEATAYAAYRSAKYQVVMADIIELYDQFGYGVDYCPLGIRNLCNYALNNWTTKPEYLFLIGKGIHTPYFRHHDSTALDTLVLVPSWGFPSSDILLTNGLGNSTFLEPGIPTGRLAAINPEEVATYLNKVEQYEQQELTPALWQKKVAHFAGGSDLIEEELFANYLNDFAYYITGPLFGADVYNFSKSSPNPVTITLADSITNLINGGESIMTFFGHAAGNDFDFSLDYPYDYANGTKYPLIIANACFSGDIFQPVGAINNVTSVSEQWVLESPGAIAFLASDYLGNPLELGTYTSQLYEDFGQIPYYRKSLGVDIQNVVGEVQGAGSDFYMVCTCLEMTLHGDPAITLCQYDSLPDYAVTDTSIYFTPSNVTVQSDSFDVHVVVSNYAEAVNQPVTISVTRFFPNNTTQNYIRTFPNIYFQDTVVIRMPVLNSSGVGAGINHFCVDVDPSNLLKEITKTNNNNYCSTLQTLLISSGDIIPVWPYDYAIIPNANWDTLKACTGDPFAPVRNYIFEIDTTDSFKSKWVKSQIVTSAGGVVNALPGNWVDTIYPPRVLKKQVDIKKGTYVASIKNTGKPIKPVTETLTGAQKISGAKPANQTIENIKNPAVSGIGTIAIKNNPGLKGHPLLNEKYEHISPSVPSFLNLPSGQVYYWRVRRDTTDLIDYPWEESSFQYMNHYTGWGQSQYFQFMDDEISQNQYNLIDTNDKKRQWHFSTGGEQLQCNTFGTPSLNTTLLYATDYTINFIVQSYAGCKYNPAIYVAILDSVTLQPWSNSQEVGWGNVNNANSTCKYPDNKLIYTYQGANRMDSLTYFLKSVVPNGDYILAYTWIEGYFKEPAVTDTTFIGEFAKLGSKQFEMRKKTPGMDSVPFVFFVQKGHPASVKEIFGKDASDSLTLTTVLKTSGTYGSVVTPFIGPAAKYDSLSWSQHSLTHTSTDSVRLNIIGEEPSGTLKTLMANITPAVAQMYISSINPKLYPYIQLMMFTQDLVTHNPSQMNWWRVFYTPVPELAVNPNISTYFLNDTLQVGDTLKFKTVVQNISEYPMDTTQLHTWVMDQHSNMVYSRYSKIKKLVPGDTSMLSMTWLPTNSYIGNNSVWFEVNPLNMPQTQLEQYHFNNYAEKNFNSFGDRINPLLDVTFNGIHILDNDIVSPTPSILITVMDENKYLALNDPKDVQVYINNVNSPEPIPVPYGPQLTFTPAYEPHNRCSVLYTPTLADGTYQLTVQAVDRSSNLSAINSYKIDFQVINKSMISEVVNYPNPFSTSTRFVFILTGDQIPTTFKIQIMTVTGKVVREITESEIGPIHIGRNITQYAWDGTDQFGSKLANGVYLYRVQTSVDGMSLDDYATGADQYFTKGWGKMYILR